MEHEYRSTNCRIRGAEVGRARDRPRVTSVTEDIKREHFHFKFYIACSVYLRKNDYTSEGLSTKLFQIVVVVVLDTIVE